MRVCGHVCCLSVCAVVRNLRQCGVCFVGTSSTNHVSNREAGIVLCRIQRPFGILVHVILKEVATLP